MFTANQDTWNLEKSVSLLLIIDQTKRVASHTVLKGIQRTPAVHNYDSKEILPEILPTG